MTASVQLLLFHLPLIGVLLIFGFIALIDAGVLKSFRNESTFGWMVLVWYPLGAILGLIQVALWIRWIAKRGITAWTVSQKTRRIVFVGFLIATAIVLGVLVLRVAQRWGFLG